MNLSILSRTKQTGKKGCVIFDDLMSELSECGLLLDLFSKYSSHYDLTTIHITQNIFFKAGGKHGSDHVTIYRNTHVLVLFKNLLDNTVIHTIAQRISRGKKYRELVDMLHHVLDHHRYIVIMGDLKTSPKLKYCTVFLLHIPYLIRLYIIWKILAEKTCLQQVSNTFHHGKICKK